MNRKTTSTFSEKRRHFLQKAVAQFSVYRSLPAAAVLCLAAALAACQEEVPMVSLGIDEEYYQPRMSSLRLTSALTGEAYRWTLTTPAGKDSIVGTERSYTFVQAEEGTYELHFEILDPVNPYSHIARITVVHEETEYSPYISEVCEYRPAPGQFVNLLPAYEEGDTEEDMRKKAEESISGRNDVMVSLGGFGGYITFRFDHTVMNRPGAQDFAIYGNAFYAAADPTQSGGSAEPGIVMVAFDANCNGKADPEEWYELAGSEYDNPDTRKHYQITYLRPEEGKPAVPAAGYIDLEHIAWRDNRDSCGHIAQLTAHSQSYYPQWTDEDSLTFEGTLLPPNGTDMSGTGRYYVLRAYDWGYADNKPNSDLENISFDIDWAVDRDGNPVALPGADFIRVYTGVNQQCGWIGETSTEITRAQDLNLPEEN
ncbi:MAG: cell surface protein [Bacteroidaceae bacterium]|jgi:hypothetical protein